MPQKQKISVENNFVAGLKTDFTGLNFPENAATETYDCVYTTDGDVLRRLGFDPELNYTTFTVAESDVGAVSSYKWKNAGGDGNTQVFVVQIGGYIYFYQASNATVLSPLSTTKLAAVVDLTDFIPFGSTPEIEECQYADGNGYLFVFNKALEPFYCTFDEGTIVANQIDIKIRDFRGFDDGLEDKERPTTLSVEHEYNLTNQGWTNKPTWSVDFDDGSDDGKKYLPLSYSGNGYTGFGPHTGPHSFNIGESGLPIEEGQTVTFKFEAEVLAYNIDEAAWFNITETGEGYGVVTNYSGSTLDLNILYVNPFRYTSNWELTDFVSDVTYHMSLAPVENTIATWYEQVGNYPSNVDVWFQFNEALSTDVYDVTQGNINIDKFSPEHTMPFVVQAQSPAPKGHYIIDAFDQSFGGVSGISGLTDISTLERPRTGAWFSGRVWFAGCDDTQPPTGNQDFYTWTENIYFSQVIEDTSGDQFAKCHQKEDPTDKDNFSLLATDGGVITIQGCGSIFKLFPIQNGMLVFAANGIWFITGSSGIGFSASDYTITKISAVRNISGKSFVDVNGLPFFWNEEAIYAIEPQQQGGGLNVTPITLKNIDRFYEDISFESKRNAKGSYDPVDYVVQWLYDSNEGAETTVQGDSFLLAVGQTGPAMAMYSNDEGLTWTLSENTPGGSVIDPDYSISATWYDVTYSPSLDLYCSSSLTPLVDYLGDPTGEQVMTSPDGITWTAQTTPNSHSDPYQNAWSSILWADGLGLFVCVGQNDNTQNAMTSSDGVTWTLRTTPTGNFNDHCWAEDKTLLVATGNISTTGYIMTSPDGINWTNRTNPAAALGNCAYGNGTFVTHSSHSGMIDSVTSSDGINWTLNNGAFDVGFSTMSINRIRYFNDVFLAVGTQYTSHNNAALMSSTDGVTWTDLSPPEDSLQRQMLDVVYSPNLDKYVLIGDGLDGKDVFMCNTDGSNWITVNSPTGNKQWNALWIQTPAATTVPSNYDRILNYKIPLKAWYPWTISSGTVNGQDSPIIYDVKYVQNPGGVGAPEGVFKYVTSIPNGSDSDFTFSECYDTSYYDWDFGGATGLNYESYFVTGYKLHGNAIRRWQPEYTQIYSRNDVNTKFHLQGVWNFGSTPISGRWSNKQLVSIQDKTEFGMWTNRLRIRGSGLSLQIRVSSVDNNPFDIMGWSIMENQNPNV